MNLPYEGGGFRFAPEAVRDGWLHRYRDSAPYVSFEGGVAVAESVFWETYGSKRNYDHSSPSVSVEAQRSLPIHTDGEGVFPDIRHRWRYWKKNCISLQDNSRKI